MKPGFKVRNRGLIGGNPTTIWVFNWPYDNKVDNLFWDETDHVDKMNYKGLVAIFKIKYKQS